MTTTKSTPPNNNVIDHPDLITMRSRISTSPLNSLSSSRNSTDFSGTSFRHPAIPEEPNNLSDLDLAAENLSDLYDVVPDVLPPEEVEIVTDFIVKNRMRRPQTSSMRPPAYVRSRSHSLPVVHGNFVFINREAAKRPSNSECYDNDLNKKIRFDTKKNPRIFSIIIIYLCIHIVHCIRICNEKELYLHTTKGNSISKPTRNFDINVIPAKI